MGKIRQKTIGLEENENQKDKKIVRVSVKKGEIISEEKSTDKNVESEVKKIKKQRGENYLNAIKKIDSKKLYSLSEALSLLKEISYAKFDESVELHMSILKSSLRGEVELPFSTGISVRVAVVDDELIDKLEQNKIDFDILVTHPSFMPKLAKFARFLGPKGLMPNPKSGTVSTNPEEVVKKFQKNIIQWKSQPKRPLIHQKVSKLSADIESIKENVLTFIKNVEKKNIESIYIKTSMTPSIKIDLNQF